MLFLPIDYNSPMQLSATQTLIVSVIAVATAGAGAWYFLRVPAAAPVDDGVVLNIDPNATSTVIGGYTITRVDGEPGAAPSVDRPVTISAALSAEAAATLRMLMQELLAELKANPDRADLWLQLGVHRKIAGDYAGAIEAWQYVATGAPSSISYIAHSNLGGLYMGELKDYPKAEVNYKAAIALSPKHVAAYLDLASLYRYLYKTNTSAAADIVAEGLANNPNNPDLLALQSSLSS